MTIPAPIPASSAAEDTASKPVDFIREIINDDLSAHRHDQVVTRFPPEPNGFLHIGHAKSICLNFGLATEYLAKLPGSGSRCHLRFDDTDPVKEDTLFEDGIQADISWLGFKWGGLYHASDYFEKMYEYAKYLIGAGKAYVCSLSDAEIKSYRGTVTAAGINSPYRERTAEENLALFDLMRKGQ